MTSNGNVVELTPSRSSSQTWKNELTWNNISYEISQGRKKPVRQLLKNLTGSIKSGEMVAIMGSSGAGKTTLLNCLSGRLSTGTLSGTISYNGETRNPRTWRRTMAFVEQDDALYSQITVRETLRYAALLRLPSSKFTKDEKYARADDTLKSLRLSKAADTPIGDGSTRGVSGELVGNPEILFLDEPTSGLDSNSALAVIDNVKQDAKNTGRIVIATIHQPSFDLLSLFDTVILLSGGSTVYMGSPHAAVDYFAQLGYAITRPSQNPADFFMDLLTIDSSKSEEEIEQDTKRIALLQTSFSKDGPILSASPAISLDTVANVDDILDQDDKAVIALTSTTRDVEFGPAKSGVEVSWANNWMAEFSILFHRSWTQYIRGRDMIIAVTASTVLVVILIGFTFFRLKNDQKGIQNRNGILFFWPVNQVFNTIMPILGVFPLERVIMLRERTTRSYRVSSFYLAKVLTEIVPATFFTLLSCIPLYYMMGLRTDVASAFPLFIFIQWVQVMACLAVGFLIGAAVPSVQMAQVIGPLVGVVFLLYGGTLINNDDLPVFFRGFQYISPVDYAYRANMFNEFQGFKLTCEDPTLPCYKTGEEVLKQFSLTSYTLWGCIGINGLLFLGYLGVGFILLRVLGKPKTKLV
ncbi:P-loop containing nucleoside triphosphate hydrolase protein [Chytridium lagenaria]|nr:P-loop containing nucleoside triphosphate hydrolase protein [Chytridium lagenaria]